MRSLRHALVIALLVLIALPVLIPVVGILAWPIVIFAVSLCVASWVSGAP
jgi:hypothetical protein